MNFGCSAFNPFKCDDALNLNPECENVTQGSLFIISLQSANYWVGIEIYFIYFAVNLYWLPGKASLIACINGTRIIALFDRLQTSYKRNN